MVGGPPRFWVAPPGMLSGWVRSAAVVPVYAVWPHSAQRTALSTRFVEFLGERVAALFTPP